MDDFTDAYLSKEESAIDDYLKVAQPELPLNSWLSTVDQNFHLVVAEGFEERSIGVLKHLKEANAKIAAVTVGRYENDLNINEKYRKEFEFLSRSIAQQNVTFENIDAQGKWLSSALNRNCGRLLLFDISAISNAAMFPLLDIAATSSSPVCLGYSDAVDYWPSRQSWQSLRREAKRSGNVSDAVNNAPWLFGVEHSVRIVEGHEGYDASNGGKALVAFLPFKSARLMAVVGEHEYTEYLFIMPKPRFSKNYWRVRALREINASVINNWPVQSINTFGYRNTLKRLTDLLFISHPLLRRVDVHIAPLGSKLQSIGTWLFCSMVPSITVVSSSPAQYYPDAFSGKIGESWVVPLSKIRDPKK